MKAAVLAAGKGERLWPLTQYRPKHLLPIANKPLLIRTIEGLVKAGIRDIILVVQFKGEEIRKKIGNGRSLGCNATYVEQKKLGGTALALEACRDELAGESRFLTVYGDDYYHGDALKKFLEAARRASGVSLGTVNVENPSQFGSLEVKNGTVTSIREKVARDRPGRVNAGLYLMGQSIFPAIEKTGRSNRGEYELTDSLNYMIESGEKIRAVSLNNGDWVAMSYPWDLLEANQRALCSEKAGERGRVENGAHVKDRVIVGAGSVVKSGSYLEGPINIGRDCVIGPNAYVRAYSSIGNNVKVGAGCEVKNSIVMNGVKIPHLSYVGDSIIGQDSSLGAGTITANLRFDEGHVRSRVKEDWIDTGRKKFGAVLGDNVRTGINVSLFPGVKVGAGAWLGPGAVVDKDVAAGSRVKE